MQQIALAAIAAVALAAIAAVALAAIAAIALVAIAAVALVAIAAVVLAAIAAVVLVAIAAVVLVKRKTRDHVIVSSGWWSYQAGRVEGGGSGTRDELGALHSALREQAPPAKGGENPSLQPALCSC